MFLAAHYQLTLELVDLNLRRREGLNGTHLAFLCLDVDVPLRRLLPLVNVECFRHVALHNLGLFLGHQRLAVVSYALLFAEERALVALHVFVSFCAVRCRGVPAGVTSATVDHALFLGSFSYNHHCLRLDVDLERVRRRVTNTLDQLRNVRLVMDVVVELLLPCHPAAVERNGALARARLGCRREVARLYTLPFLHRRRLRVDKVRDLFAVLVAHVYDEDAAEVGLRDVQDLVLPILAERDDLVLVDVLVRQQLFEILDALHVVATLDLLDLMIKRMFPITDRYLLVLAVVQHFYTGLLLELIDDFETSSLRGVIRIDQLYFILVVHEEVLHDILILYEQLVLLHVYEWHLRLCQLIGLVYHLDADPRLLRLRRPKILQVLMRLVARQYEPYAVSLVDVIEENDELRVQAADAR